MEAETARNLLIEVSEWPKKVLLCQSALIYANLTRCAVSWWTYRRRCAAGPAAVPVGAGFAALLRLKGRLLWFIGTDNSFSVLQMHALAGLHTLCVGCRCSRITVST